MNTNLTPGASTPPLPTRYSATELAGFQDLIQQKLAKVRAELREATASLRRITNDTDDTYTGALQLDDGAATLEREELVMVAARLGKFSEELERALARIHNGTYGICKATGILIPKERLLLVPHATMCVAAKDAARKAA